MDSLSIVNFIEKVLQYLPKDWIELTTHRLDIYHEEKAKAEFLEEFEKLYNANKFDTNALASLPTAYDYIRLGHPLSSVLEWSIAKLNNLNPEAVICFSSQSMPLMAVLRTNLLLKKQTRIGYNGELPKGFDEEIAKRVYGYDFDLVEATDPSQLSSYDGSTIFIQENDSIDEIELSENVDFFLNLYAGLGSIILVNRAENKDYISAIQHVRRRESIAMTPANCKLALQQMINGNRPISDSNLEANRTEVMELICSITASNVKSVVGSSGLSIQYAIMMGLVDDAIENHSGRNIKFIVPTNCYGGTNDQARRVSACSDKIEVVDLEVDGENDMVDNINKILDQLAKEDAVPYIIAEIPTNPRVEVPDLSALVRALDGRRKTEDGRDATSPVFILDQTFCPNIQFLSENGILSNVKTISYVSGSKFPSGGKCTAGYAVANGSAAELMDKIEKHLILCDNEATPLQMSILAEQMPSMLQRIAEAYKNTREFVTFIERTLPSAKINFVSEELAKEGFTPSVFSLDLPTKGATTEERELYKRALNLKLINRMIIQTPNESKYCVSYGQLKGCYWTIPATSTQGTTKESDKDYIARVAVSPMLDLEMHKKVFADFVEEEINQ